MKTETKRQNFNITPEEEAKINWIKENLRRGTNKDAILSALDITVSLIKEVKQGYRLSLSGSGLPAKEIVIPGLDVHQSEDWKFLVERSHPWRKQLYVKGRRLLASAVWNDMGTNEMTVEEAAFNWDLPKEAIEEIITYCEKNQALIEMEADEEFRRLQEEGVILEP